MNKKIGIINMFWIGYFLIIFSEMFVNVKFVKNYVEIINYIGIAILIIFMGMSSIKFNKKVFLVMILLFLMGVYTYYYYRDFTIMKFLILAYCIKNIEFDDLIKKDFYIKMAFFIIILILSFLNLCEKTSFIREDKIRYTLGFIHPNTAGFYIMILTFEYLYINRSKISYKHLILLVIIILLTNIITNSRSSVIALTMMLVSLMFYKFIVNKVFNFRIVRFIIKNMVLILTMISFIIVVGYANKFGWAIWINEKLSNRAFYILNVLNSYDITLVGNFLPESVIILDNQYILFLLNFGILFYFIYYALFYIKFKQLFNEKQYFLIIILSILLIYGLMEKTTFRASYNVFMLSLSSILFFKKGVGEEDGKQSINNSSNI